MTARSNAGPIVLMSTWRDGLFAVSGGSARRELAGQSVCALTHDSRGGALAIVDGHTLYRYIDSQWAAIATSSLELSCCLEVENLIYAGTDDARVLSIDRQGRLEPLREFDTVAGRDQWYAGSALVNGLLLGPPLGVRSMAATCDGAVLLVNVHVGGIPRSSDRGKSWQPTIDIDVDVHQVCTHPTRPEWAIAAAGAGLCVSHDAGASWTIEREGLHAPYCSAVAFAGDDILVAASADHFAPEGTIYRRSFGESGPLQPLGGGPARWITGICDTACIDVNGSVVALADRAGNVHLSEDLGRSWSCCATGHPSPSAVVIL